MNPLITAIVPVYNEQRHIQQCLDTLIQQSYSPIEILVADDGSTDDTPNIVRATPGVRLLPLAHRGKAHAINQAARQARGEILLFLDGDLYFDRDYVSNLVKPMLTEDAVGSSHATEQ